MDRVSDYRKQADHARQLAEATWQDNLEEMLHRLARDFDEIAEDIEADATELHHPELLRAPGILAAITALGQRSWRRLLQPLAASLSLLVGRRLRLRTVDYID
jgi:hypothetical protein